MIARFPRGSATCLIAALLLLACAIAVAHAADHRPSECGLERGDNLRLVRAVTGDGALPTLSFELPAPVSCSSDWAPDDSLGFLRSLLVDPRAPRAPPLLLPSSA